MASNGSGAKKHTTEGYLRNMAKIFAGVGSKDPRLDVPGNIKFCLYRQLFTYTWSEPPTDPVHPISIYLLHKCWRHPHAGDAHQKEISDLLCIGFFFLYKTGEY